MQEEKIKIIVQCAHNLAHHSHVKGIISPLLSMDSRIEIVIIHFTEDKLGVFKEFIDSNRVTFLKIDYKINSIESLVRFIRLKIKGSNYHDYSLSYSSLKNEINESDAIILTELSNGVLFKKINEKIKVIWSMHGPVSTDFGHNCDADGVDLILSPGESTSKSLKYLNTVNVGSVKLSDYCFSNKRGVTKEELFGNSNKTFIFNPHFNIKLGACAWYEYGVELLRYFEKNKDMNLIFAPHPKLLEVACLNELDKFTDFSNIYVDLRSKRLSDLSYQGISDVYIGDISSNVLEYVYLKRRPLIFFEGEKEPSKETKLIHAMGTIITNKNDIDRVIQQSPLKKQAQDDYIKIVFEETGVNPCEKAAASIVSMLERAQQ